jgi:leader peptidase (prepilin peptidase) / N-methyltransferase
MFINLSFLIVVEMRNFNHLRYNLTMQSPIMLVPVLFVGWVSGAFLNYLADVLPYRRQSAVPFCTKCGRQMTWKNYFLWPRRCGFCNTIRSRRTWIVETLAPVAAVWLWLAPPDRFGFFVGLILLLYFGLIVIIDIEHRLILHWVSLTGLIIGIGLGVWTHGISQTILGGVIGFGTMLVLFYAGKLILKLITRRQAGAGEEQREALGFGDVILGGIIGLILGFHVILWGLVFAVFIGGIYSFLYLVSLVISKRYKMLSMIPYGPFLIASAVFILYFPKVAAVLTKR